MSGTLPANEPDCIDAQSSSDLLRIDARPRMIAGFAVRRVLPSIARRLVGPFIFFDHMGPAQLTAGTGLDVLPHPHIGLATLTYLFEGELDHRDSLGSTQRIRPGDVNWMVAGRGVAHSERSPAASRIAGPRVHGIQSWVALPAEHEDAAGSFEHHPSATIPTVRDGGAVLEIIAGSAYGQRSPVSVLSPTLYVHARLDAGARIAIDDAHEERAVYVVDGAIQEGARAYGAGTMVVLRPDADVTIKAEEPARVMIVGGAKLAGKRHVWWNFVSSSSERIERAKADWREGRFAKIPGDEVDFVPLPAP